MIFHRFNYETPCNDKFEDWFINLFSYKKIVSLVLVRTYKAPFIQASQEEKMQEESQCSLKLNKTYSNLVFF